MNSGVELNRLPGVVECCLIGAGESVGLRAVLEDPRIVAVVVTSSREIVDCALIVLQFSRDLAKPR
jgi:hypothetical protein